VPFESKPTAQGSAGEARSTGDKHLHSVCFLRYSSRCSDDATPKA
jgi:hypothetical protein